MKVTFYDDEKKGLKVTIKADSNTTIDRRATDADKDKYRTQYKGYLRAKETAEAEEELTVLDDDDSVTISAEEYELFKKWQADNSTLVQVDPPEGMEDQASSAADQENLEDAKGVAGDEDLKDPVVIVNLDIFASTVTEALKAGGIESVEDLTSLTEDEVLEMTTGIGPAKIEDIKESLASHGLGLKIED